MLLRAGPHWHRRALPPRGDGPGSAPKNNSTHANAGPGRPADRSKLSPKERCDTTPRRGLKRARNSGCPVSTALRTAAEAAPLPPVSGCSERALRVVLCRIAQLAQQDGSLRYGLRVSKLSTLVLYSPATVKRAQAGLVDAGFLERVRVGGGRVSTRWRLRLEALGLRSPEPSRPVDNRPSGPAPRAGTSPGMGRQTARREPGQGHPQGSFSGMIDRSPFHDPQTKDCTHGANGPTYCAFCRRGTEPAEVQLTRVLSSRHRR